VIGRATDEPAAFLSNTVGNGAVLRPPSTALSATIRRGVCSNSLGRVAKGRRS